MTGTTRRLLLGLVALLVLLLAAAWLALRSEGVQRALLGKASAALESSLGLTIEAETVRLRPLRGAVELERVTVRNAEGGALAAAERAAGGVLLRPLLRGRVVVPAVELERLRFDLDEWPAAGEEDPSEPEGTAGPAVEIRRLRVVDGELAGVPLPDGGEGWPSGDTFTGIDLEASLVDGRLRVEVESASIDLARSGAEPVTVALTGNLDGPVTGPYELTGVRLSGSEIDLDLSATIGLDERQPMRLSFDGWLEAGRWIDPRQTARLSTGGEIDFRSAQGRVELDAPRIPAELLGRWLEPALGGRLDVAGSTFDVGGELRLGPGALDRVGGTLDVAWSRDENELVKLRVVPEIAAAAGTGRIGFELELTPGQPGLRQASGILEIPGWRDLGAATLEQGTVDLRLPDLRAALASIERLAPGATSTLPAGLGGALNVEATLAGPLGSPRIGLEADWRPDRASSLEVSADGELLALRGRLEARARRLGLDRFGPDLGGVLDGRVQLALAGGRRSGSFELEGQGLAAGELSGLEFSANGELNDDSLRFSRLSVDWQGHRLETSARIDLTADGARLIAERLTLDGVSGELTADVPGVLLEGLPATLRPAWATPAARARRVRLAWTLPESDLGPPLGLDDTVLEVASSGELWIDLDRPAASSGEVHVPSARWSADDRLAGLGSPLAVQLGDRRLSTRSLRFETPASSFEGAVTIELAETWRPGDAAAALIAGARLDGSGEIGPDWLGQALGLDAGGSQALAFDADLAADRTAIGGRLLVDGAGSRLDATGTVDLDRDRVEAEGWLAAARAIDLTAVGSVHAQLAGGLLGLEAVADQGAPGGLQLEIGLAGAIEALSGRLTVDGADAAWVAGEGGVRVAAPRIELRLDERQLTLSELRLDLNGEPLEARGTGRLDDGRLDLERLEVAFAGIESRWSASVPWISGEGEHRELWLEWSIAEAALEPALGLFGLIDPGDTLRAGSSGRLRLAADDPTAAEGTAEITGFDWWSRGRQTTSRGPIRLRLAEGRLTLEPLELLSRDQLFELRANAELARPWSPEAGLVGLVKHLDIRGDGTLLTSLLNPFLAGAVAEGYLAVELEARGSPDALRGRLSVSGAEATLTYARPYVTRISEPELELVLEPGGVATLEGRLRLNEGQVKLSGSSTEEGLLLLDAELERLRFRLDYGLLVLLNGDLTLARSTAGAWGLGGTVAVQNGVLTRDIDVDLDFVLALLAPVDLTSTEESPLELVALDLDLTTVEGVRVKNNVADMLVRWDPVKIGGTLATPVLDGRFEIDPGGRVRAFGQTVRIDSATIDYPGVADLPATLEFETTSSFEDPSIAGLEAEDPFASERDVTGEEPDRVAAAAAGLGTFYGERLASRLTGGLTGAQVSLQPLLIFGETDPGARLTVTQDVSPQVALAASVDLRNAEAQTYLLDLHGLEALPGLNAQIFTTDQASEGVALRQRVLLGPGGAQQSTGSKIRRIRYELPDGVSKRRIKRVLGLRKGDRLADGTAFAAEVEVAESLRRRGYSDARATVTVNELDTDEGVELVVSARPGPRARFVFEGEKLPKALRRSVIGLYRPDYYEPVALEEMAAEARRALRSRGFLDPRVEVAVRPGEPDDPTADRVVTVALAGGERIDLERIRFVPLPADEAAVLQTRFSRPVRRIELAAGLPDADRRVEQTLRFLGYTDSRVVSRSLSSNGKELEVVVEVGERPRIGRIEITGVEPEEAERLAALLELRPGDPVRSDRVASAAVLLRDDLESRGYADARVEPHVEASATEPGRLADLRFEVDPGSSYFVGEVSFSGLETTRRGFVRKVADLPLETDYSQDAVLEARRRLRRTHLFETVTPEVVRAPGGVVRVEFDVRERKRFELAYGLRWDSVEDLGVLVEVIDRNAFGQAWTLGARAQWAENDQSLRLFAGLPRLFDPYSSLSFFTAVREETEGNLLTETFDNTLQLSYEISQRLTARLYGKLTETRVSEIIPDPRLPFEFRFTQPVLGTQVLYDSRRGDVLFHGGTLVTGDLSVSHETLGSDFEYARFFGQVNYYRRLTSSRSLVWAQSLRVGLADAFDQVLIRPDRFFAGGEFSVRGYLSESLGPQERLGLTTRAAGGEALLVINQELRWRFAEGFTGVGFLDAGNVWADRGDFGSDLFTSIGLGLRAATPVGIVRLDLAHALDRRVFDPEFKIYVGFGSTF